MGIISKCAAVAVAAAIAVGASASAASAITISGGPTFTAAWDSSPTMSLGGVYQTSCTGGFSGTVTGGTTMTIQPDLECTNTGFPVAFDAPDGLELEIVSGPDGFGIYGYTVTVPSGTAVVASMPIAGCTVTVSGPQTLGSGLVAPVGYMQNVLSGGLPAIELDASVGSIAYTASGCPVGSDTNGTFDSNGPGVISGVSITP